MHHIALLQCLCESSTERDVYHCEGSLPPLEMSVRDTFHCEKCLALGALWKDV